MIFKEKSLILKNKKSERFRDNNFGALFRRLITMIMMSYDAIIFGLLMKFRWDK